MASDSQKPATLSGQYIEARTCDIWTAPCFANAEINLAGRNALMAWRIDQGKLDDVDLQGLGEDYLKTYVQKVNAVTPADVQKMTAEYIKPDQMTIVVVGDKSKITDQLAPYAAASGGGN